MDVVTGIAIAGVWVFAGMIGLSNTTSGIGWVLVLAAFCAAVVTTELV